MGRRLPAPGGLGGLLRVGDRGAGDGPARSSAATPTGCARTSSTARPASSSRAATRARSPSACRARRRTARCACGWARRRGGGRCDAFDATAQTRQLRAPLHGSCSRHAAGRGQRPSAATADDGARGDRDARRRLVGARRRAQRHCEQQLRAPRGVSRRRVHAFAACGAAAGARTCCRLPRRRGARRAPPAAAGGTSRRRRGGATPAITRPTATPRSSTSRICAHAAREFLVIPATSAWWLEHYDAFTEHLDTRYVALAERRDGYVLYALAPGAAAKPSARAGQGRRERWRPARQRLHPRARPRAATSARRSRARSARRSTGSRCSSQTTPRRTSTRERRRGVRRQRGCATCAIRRAARRRRATATAASRAARGRYVAWLDADDAYLPGALARQVALLEAHPGGARSRTARFEVVDAAGRRLPDWPPPFARGHASSRAAVAFAHLHRSPTRSRRPPGRRRRARPRGRRRVRVAAREQLGLGDVAAARAARRRRLHGRAGRALPPARRDASRMRQPASGERLRCDVAVVGACCCAERTRAARIARDVTARPAALAAKALLHAGDPARGERARGLAARGRARRGLAPRTLGAARAAPCSAHRPRRRPRCHRTDKAMLGRLAGGWRARATASASARRGGARPRLGGGARPRRRRRCAGSCRADACVGTVTKWDPTLLRAQRPRRAQLPRPRRAARRLPARQRRRRRRISSAQRAQRALAPGRSRARRSGGSSTTRELAAHLGEPPCAATTTTADLRPAGRVSRGRIAIAGSIAQKPHQAGHAWLFLQYLLGFRRLGWDVLFLDRLDDCADAGAERGGRALPRRERDGALRARRRLVGRADGDGAHAGVPRGDVLEHVGAPTLLLNVMGFLDDEELLGRGARARLPRHRPRLRADVARRSASPTCSPGHDAHVTIGERIGAAGLHDPDRAAWTGSRRRSRSCSSTGRPQPIAPRAGASRASASWRGAYGPIDYEGTRYGLRVHEFRRFAELPRAERERVRARARHPSGRDSRPRRCSTANGWRLVDPRDVAGDPGRYRALLAGLERPS